MWEEFAKQTPSLAIMGFMVWKFLDHLKGKDKANFALQRDTNQVIKDNTAALTKFSDSVGHRSRRT